MKKTKSSFALGISMYALTIAHPANAVEHSNKLVSELQAVNPTTDCFFFRLEGVAQADPVKPNDQWFAMSRSHSGATCDLCVAAGSARKRIAAVSSWDYWSACLWICAGGQRSAVDKDDNST
jgi:hypothetical protein